MEKTLFCQKCVFSVSLDSDNNKCRSPEMELPYIALGLLVFTWIIPDSQQNLNLYMDEKETERLLGKFFDWNSDFLAIITEP